ncbi:MAG TPA: MBL fold metallo-hydrolase [Clostridiales bacterium]|nr:MBL fold metallo-hydrolase [Clostridiales bacterium]
MPDKAGAFLKASEVISFYGGNIVRVSYNKAVDLHTLFIDVSANQEQLEKITEKLKIIGYLTNQKNENKVILISLKLSDKPGSVKPVLDILNCYDINISYMNSQENGTEYQYFKMGLFIEEPKVIKDLLDEVSKICDVKIIEYNVSEKILDSTVFYISFANEMRNLLLLSQEQTNEFIINSNKIMQIFDEKNELPHKTFEYIRRFARFVVDHKGDNFNAVISKKKISDKVTLHLIEPPCGSNTYILEGENELLFVDSGFACFENEMQVILNNLFPNFKKRRRSIILTHSDIDHAGLASLFDIIYVSKASFENFQLEQNGMDNFREQNLLHAPYCRLSRIISRYTSPNISKLKVIGQKADDGILSNIGEFSFEDLNFKVFEGNGGHIKGEIILICDDIKLIFTGDNLVNMRGFSPDQQEFNLLAPYLMTSVNVDSEKATLCRNELLKKTEGHLICPGHGTWCQ